MTETSEEDKIFELELLCMTWNNFSLHLHMMVIFWPFNMSKGVVPLIDPWYGCFVEE